VRQAGETQFTLQPIVKYLLDRFGGFRMREKMRVYIIVALLTIQAKVFAAAPHKSSFIPEENSEWITGADVSYLNQMEDHGAVYSDMGIEKDALKILNDHWFNTIRLRLWHTPSDAYCSLENTAIMARRIKALGMNFLLDIHYSDTWADIVTQPKPAAWENLPFAVLVDSVYQYTKKVIRTLKEQNATPDIVQIGNEITHGMLWDDGRVGDAFHTPQQWQQFTDLLKAGIQGVKDNEEFAQGIKIMIHIHCGGDNGFSTWFFDNLTANGVDFDLIGLSFYTSWGSTLQQLQANMNDLAGRYHKDIVVVEAAYPWSLLDHDWFPNQVTDTTQLQTGYDASVQGQKKYLKDMTSIIQNVPDSRGKGVVYYSWDNNTLFNPQGGLLSSVDAFNPEGIHRVTLNLNSASIPDTLGINAFFEVRGSANGIAPYTFPNGQILDWSENSTIEPASVKGDYFTTTFYAPVQTQLQFKFWSEDLFRWGTNGWEVGNTGTNQTGDMLLTVTGDTTLPLHFFNGLGEQKSYDWRLCRVVPRLHVYRRWHSQRLSSR
jgi:arabinogalactan endo-1,4-beta-galactosidase